MAWPRRPTLEDLTQADYRDLLVVENPATSSPGLAFLLATVGHFGDPGYLDYWRALRANGVEVVNGWETAYNSEFSGSAGHGPRPIVVSYGSSPPFEVIYASQPLSEAPTGGRRRSGHLLPANRIRGHPPGHPQPRAGGEVGGLHALGHLPG